MISFWNWALGLSVPWRWFFTATCAICSSVVPCLAMWARAISAKTPGKVEPGGLLEDGVRGVRENLGRALGGHRQDPLGAAHQEDVGRAGADLEERVAEGRVARGARGLEAGGRHGRDAQRGGDLGAEVELALSRLADDVADVDALDLARADARVGQRLERGLREQLRARALVLAELGHAETDDRDPPHVPRVYPTLRNLGRVRSMVASWRPRTRAAALRSDRSALGPGSGPLGLCLLGCGRFATFHARAARRLRGAARIAFASRDPARAEAYRRRFGGFAAFGSYEAAAADPRVDALVICTPHHLHEAHARLAAEHGKSILLEKPIARTLAEADAILAAARAAGVVLMVGENFHFAPGFAAAGEYLQGGAIGAVRQLVVTARGYRRARGLAEPA